MESSRYRTYASVDCSAIRHNYEIIRSRTGAGCKIMSVIKADGYGHGAVKTAQTLSDSDYFGVACMDEALQLRENGINTPVLILGYTSPSRAQGLSEQDLTQCVFDEAYAKELHRALAPEQKLKVHLKIDTGMSRLGFYAHDTETAKDTAKRIAELIRATPRFEYEGIFTHFTSSEKQDKTETEEQFALFHTVLEELQKRNVVFQLRHCANSAATLNHPETHLDMVRPGIALYGYSPDPATDFGLKPALNLRAAVAQVHRLNPGDAVSYNRTFRAESPMDVATVCIGYGDGLHRALSNGAPVLIRGQKTKILGRVCMDQCIIDVTGIPAVPGDEVTLIGTDGTETVTADELAACADTISYEILCSLGKRIPRIYPEN